MGYDALLFNDSVADGFPFGWYNNAVGANALTSNVDGYSNNAFGNHALFFNVSGVANTAIGYYTLWNNDSDALGLANGNTAVGASRQTSTTLMAVTTLLYLAIPQDET